MLDSDEMQRSSRPIFAATEEPGGMRQRRRQQRQQRRRRGTNATGELQRRRRRRLGLGGSGPAWASAFLVSAALLLTATLLLQLPGPVGAIRRLPSEVTPTGLHVSLDGRGSEGASADTLGTPLDTLGDDEQQRQGRRRLALLSHRSHSTPPDAPGREEGLRRGDGDTLETPPASEGNEGPEHQTRRAAEIKPSDHLVTSLPLLDASAYSAPHYAGHLPASSDPNDKKLFYWLFSPDTTFGSNGKKQGGNVDPSDPSVPLVIWLNGGPGCSSMDGLFLENGPFRLTPNGSAGWKVEVNDQSWHTMPAWVLYVDQPVGTGLSFTKKKKYCKNDREVNGDFHYFLIEFFKVYGEVFLTQDADGSKTVNRKVYFSGESHAGHYIPSMMAFILKRNDDTSTPPEVKIPLAGAAIGNGWVDPYNQYAAATAAYGMGLIDFAQKAHFDKLEIECQRKMDGGNLDAGVCFRLLDDIVAESHGGSSGYRVSQYDNRKWESKNAPRTFPPGHKDVESYLGGWDKSSPKIGVDYKTVLEAIHATESIEAKQRYQECTDPPFDALRHQDGLGVIDDVVFVLDHPTKPRMLFFNGMNDLICNHAGNERFLDLMPWRHAKDWTLAKRYVWTGPNRKDGPPGGYLKEYENLMFLKVPNSGHMVPMDQPEVSLEMMRVLVGGGSFRDSEQNVDREDPRDGVGSCEPCPSCPAAAAVAPEVVDTVPAVDDDDGGDGSDGVEQGSEAVRSLISGGWMGAALALVGVLAAFLLVIGRRRRRRGAQVMRVDGSRGVEGDDDVDDDDYEFDLQLEMNGNGVRAGGGAGGKKGGRGGPPIPPPPSEYRDVPLDSNGNNGGRSSASTGEII